jgi:hypothetical protein
VSLLGAIAVAQEAQLKSETANQVSKAVVPRLIRFGGALKEGANKPLQGAQDVTFSLYREEEGGEPLWSETQTVEADVQGRYAVLLGAMHPEGLSTDLFTSGEARWLGVSVGRLPEQPRILLVAVPYALKAADADTLGGKPATAFVVTDQLKDQVRTELSSQESSGKLGGKTFSTLVGTTSATPQAALTSPTSGAAITSGQSSFACTTTTPCVTVSQSSTGFGIQSSAKTLALYGLATQTAGTAYGVQGRTASTGGRGVFGYATATTGGTIGVYGLALSTSGIGVFGDATAAAGATRGVIGRTASIGGIGVWGYATKTLGSTTGVRGDVWSINGIPGIFDNRANGKILSGRVNGDERFYVNGDGGATGLYASGSSTGVVGSGYAGVAGSGLATGVSGYASSGTGVFGSGYYQGVFGISDNYQGVYGLSGNNTGVYGEGHVNGVYGLSGTDTGVYGDGYIHGMYGYSASDTGVGGYGYYQGVSGSSDYTGVYGSGGTAGVRGESYSSGVGVWGIGWSYGVNGYAYASDGAGVYGESPLYGVYGKSHPQAGGIAVYADGDIAYTGSIIAPVALLSSNRVVSLNAMQSPENWSEDFGSGQLQSGAAEIALDPTFAETVNTEAGYHVFVTPSGNCEGLYVARKGDSGFEVRELKGGKSNVAFDYRIVARRRGYETVRLQQVEADEEVVKKLRDQASTRSSKPPRLILPKRPETLKQPARPAARTMRPARPAMMQTPRMPNGLELLQTPLGRNFAVPTR